MKTKTTLTELVCGCSVKLSGALLGASPGVRATTCSEGLPLPPELEPPPGKVPEPAECATTRTAYSVKGCNPVRRYVSSEVMMERSSGESDWKRRQEYLRQIEQQKRLIQEFLAL